MGIGQKCPILYGYNNKVKLMKGKLNMKLICFARLEGKISWSEKYPGLQYSAEHEMFAVYQHVAVANQIHCYKQDKLVCTFFCEYLYYV